MTTPTQRTLQTVRRLRIARPRDLAGTGLTRAGLARLVETGKLTKVGRGLYSLPGADLGEKESVLLAAARVPGGVFSLLTALRLHDLTTQNPSEVWITIPHKARKPVTDYPTLRIIRASGPGFESGITHVRIKGRPVRVYSVAKTVVDCFKFRSLVGQDVAAEALRDSWRKRKTTMDELWKYAKLARVANVMRPYLETLG
jgi:predicted transcriptional regulator of viral defense system